MGPRYNPAMQTVPAVPGLGRPRGAPALALLALLAAATATAQPATPREAASPAAVLLPPDLDRVLRDYEREWRTGDGAGLAALFTDDGFAVQSGSPLARGPAAIAGNITGPGGELRLSAYAFSVSGSVGYIVGGYRYPDTTGPGGRFVLALRKGADGRWRIAADLDNSGPPPAAPASDDRATLAALNADYVRAVLTSDAARFRDILAGDFRNTNPDGTILDRAGFLAQVARPSNLKRLRAEDVEIRVMGNTAIIHARTEYETSDGRPGSGRYTDIWQKQEGRWLAVAAHVTRLVR
jgi:ketosteroid isomerase-like protein